MSSKMEDVQITGSGQKKESKQVRRCQTFEVFPKLPNEIQNAVWDAACDVGSSIIQAFTVNGQYNLVDGVETGSLTYFTTPAPPCILGTTVISRDRALHNYAVVNTDFSTYDLTKKKQDPPAGPSEGFYVNFKTDIFYIHVEPRLGLHESYTLRDERAVIPAIFKDIQHLAIDLNTDIVVPQSNEPKSEQIQIDDKAAALESERKLNENLEEYLHGYVKPALQHFPILKTLTIVIPEKGTREKIADLEFAGFTQKLLSETSGLVELNAYGTNQCWCMENKLKQWMEVMQAFYPEKKWPAVKLMVGARRR